MCCQIGMTFIYLCEVKVDPLYLTLRYAKRILVVINF